MAFESGVMSVSLFYVGRSLPDTVVSAFSKKALPPLDLLGRGPLRGWVAGRHLLDRNITDNNAYVAGRLRLTLVKAERKIPEALLRAECMMEELAVLAADDRDFLNRKTRSEIRQQVIARLLPTMPPTLTGIPIVHDSSEDILYAGATTDKQLDALMLSFREVTGISLVPLTPQTAALRRHQVDAEDLPPTSFSPDCEDALAGTHPGRDFLTWLWFFSEERGGSFVTDGTVASVMLEGPLTFFMEGEGAHVAVLRQGAPLVSLEDKTALLSGKKLRQARIVLAREDETWSANLAAESFLLRGFKLPRGEAMDMVSRFEERMLSLGRFRDLFLGLYDRFLEERTNPERWSTTCREIRRWVAERQGKA